MVNNMVQYVIVRGDLQRKLKWPVGAVIAQACHACSAVMHLYGDDANTKAYAADLDAMHKVVLETPDEDSLRQLAKDLTDCGIDHRLWMEHPEDIPTCLATKPYNKEDIAAHFKHLKLMK